MSKKIIEEYLTLKENLPEVKFGSGDGTLTEVSKVFIADMYDDDSNLSETEKKKRYQHNINKEADYDYLVNLTDDQFYFLLSSFDLGKTLYIYNSIAEDINHFGGENELIESNLEIMKQSFPTKEDGIEYLMGIDNKLVVNSLKKYLEGLGDFFD